MSPSNMPNWFKQLKEPEDLDPMPLTSEKRRLRWLAWASILLVFAGSIYFAHIFGYLVCLVLSLFGTSYFTIRINKLLDVYEPGNRYHRRTVSNFVTYPQIGGRFYFFYKLSDYGFLVSWLIAASTIVYAHLK